MAATDRIAWQSCVTSRVFPNLLKMLPLPSPPGFYHLHRKRTNRELIKIKDNRSSPFSLACIFGDDFIRSKAVRSWKSGIDRVGRGIEVRERGSGGGGGGGGGLALGGEMEEAMLSQSFATAREGKMGEMGASPVPQCFSFNSLKNRRDVCRASSSFASSQLFVAWRRFDTRRHVQCFEIKLNATRSTLNGLCTRSADSSVSNALCLS